MYSFLSAVKYFFANSVLRVRVIVCFVFIFLLASLCIVNTDRILINLPFTDMEFFAPKFVLILFLQPVWSLLLWSITSLKVPKYLLFKVPEKRDK